VIFGLCSTLDPSAQGFSQGTRATFLKGTRWDLKSTLKIRFMDGSPNLWDRVERDAKIWADLTGLTFQFIRPPDTQSAPVRVAFTTALGVRPEEFSSSVGTQALQVSQFLPTIKLGFTPRVLADQRDTTRLILHEFGHMMGLIHEHQNPDANIQFDRNALLAVFGPLGWDAGMIDRNIIQRFDPSLVVATPFDRQSVMLYAFDSRVARPPTQVSYELSENDKRLIRQIYEAQGADPTSTTGPPASTSRPTSQLGIPLSIGTPSEEEFYTGNPANAVFFQFQVKEKKTYVMQTLSTQTWVMALLGPDDPLTQIAIDEHSRGEGGNAKIEAELSPGVYFLKVVGRRRDEPGSFRARVDPKSS
jgi:hypothetical protein